MYEMIDFHCHPDLYNNNFKILRYAEENNFKIIAMTNLPGLYKQYKDRFNNENAMRISLGYHPQLIEDYPNEIKVFLKYVKEAKFIGEVGLDISSSKSKNIEKQKEIFSKIIYECNRLGNKIISIHSRKADHIIFNYLKKGNCIYILHWYTGNIKRLLHAMSNDDNIYVSINLNMTSTINGRKLIESVPLSKILLETDAPFTKETSTEYPKSILNNIANEIAKIKDCDPQEAVSKIKDNSYKILCL